MLNASLLGILTPMFAISHELLFLKTNIESSTDHEFFIFFFFHSQLSSASCEVNFAKPILRDSEANFEGHPHSELPTSQRPIQPTDWRMTLSEELNSLPTTLGSLKP